MRSEATPVQQTEEDLLKSLKVGDRVVIKRKNKGIETWVEGSVVMTYGAVSIRLPTTPNLDPIVSNVYADFLEERGEATAAGILRREFPLGPPIPRSLATKEVTDDKTILPESDSGHDEHLPN